MKKIGIITGATGGVGTEFVKQLLMEDLDEIWAVARNEKKPHVEYLVNNAGLGRMGSYKDFTMEEIEQTINVNCKAPVILSNLCIPYMGKGSKILNISSASSFQPNPYINLYAASKVFERSYSRALNVELEGTGILSMAVCPGWIDTEMLQKEINGKKVKKLGICTWQNELVVCQHHMRNGKEKLTE